MITALLRIRTSIKNLSFINCGIEAGGDKQNFIDDIKSNATCYKIELKKNKISDSII